MINQKIKVLHEMLRYEGLTITDEYAAKIVQAISDAPDSVFEVGDFVMVYEGMGEVGFGKVEGVKPNGYRIRPYEAQGKFADYVTGRSTADVRELSTQAEADDYDAKRRGLIPW
jgi:hypothetical protein